MNRHIINLIPCKDNFYKKFVRGKNSMLHLLTFNILQNHLNQFIQKAKQNYVKKSLGSLVIHRPALNVTGLC